MPDPQPPHLSAVDLDAVLFDLDGVLTRTAQIHARSWKELFDAYLSERSDRTGEPFESFEIETDHRTYVHGRPRYEAVERLLASRGIELPRGAPEDPPDRETVCGLGNRKDEIFHQHLVEEGVEVYEDAVGLVHRLQAAGLGTAVVSSSRNASDVLDAAGLGDLFDVRVDGVVAEEIGLPGKPAPDVFLEAADRLGSAAADCAVFEDAPAGVEAGRRGRFALLVGVDRTGHTKRLHEAGADVVVQDLSRVTVDGEDGSSADRLPSALDRVAEILDELGDRELAVFLDYDGTLTPIVTRPELATLDEAMRERIRRLSRACTVAVVSGRDLRDVRDRVDVEGLVYAGSHGFEIQGPEGMPLQHEEGQAYLDALDEAEADLEDALAGVEGALVERKRYAIAAHHRQVADEDVPEVERAVEDVLADHTDLRKGRGKQVLELQPDVDWDKGKALEHVLSVLDLDRPDVLALYVGDDVTDEDAFQALADEGVSVLVRDGADRPTAADYTLEGPDEVGAFLDRLTEHV